VGVKSYGRAPTFLMTTGFEQVRSVVAAIAGDLEAADRVALRLPETGVCGVTPSSSDSAACCCWIPEPEREAAVATAASSCGTRSCGPRHKDGQTVAAAASDFDCALEARRRGCCGSAQSPA
jgi:hypothetical protein